MGKWIVLRSQPDERGGLYFVARVENPGRGDPRGDVRRAGDRPRGDRHQGLHASRRASRSGSQLFEIGLTGTDWAGPRVLPVAWEVELQAADGEVIARKVSYLWEKPDR